jgi:endonuclease/exonuclease/phosphatase family metal-dependent hydrolase
MLKHIQSIALVFLICSDTSWGQTFYDLEFGTEETLEIATWNIEWFPKDGFNTVNYVSEIIEALEIDVFAIQEIDDTTAFVDMVNQMEGYDYVMMNGWFGGLVYVYNTEHIQVLEAYEIYTEEEYWSPFPRSPLVLKFSHNSEILYAINNHFKCCGDEEIDLDDDGDEEMRRLIASTLIEEHISEELADERVIVLGDLNDLINEVATSNVFTPFLNLPNKYRFADMDIALGSSNLWSYPDWPSHIDHILITDELFGDFENENTVVEVIDIARHMGGWISYASSVSDHRPVAMRIALSPSGVGDLPEGSGDKELVGITDVLGRECKYAPGRLLIYRYSDGSATRRVSSSESQPE